MKLTGQRCLYRHFFACFRVGKSDALGMQHQSAAAAAIKPVADNRASQAAGMGTMHAQLVRTSCAWLQLHERQTVSRLEALEPSDSPFAPLVVYHLPRTVCK